MLANLFSKGVILEQLKEPAISRDLKGFYYTDSTDVQMSRPPLEDFEGASMEQLVEIARDARIIDERDNAPLYKKLMKARRAGVRIIVADAMDDQPYVSSQLGPALKLPDQLAGGLKAAAKAINAQKTYIAVYKNIELRSIKIPKTLEGVEVRRIGGRYPAEIRVEDAFKGEKDRRILLVGTGALIHFHRAVTKNVKQTTCFVTVAGNCIANPCNVEVSIGMPVRRLLEHYGLIDEPQKVIVGGSMTGRCITDPANEHVEPATRAVLAFLSDKKDKQYNCIGCGRCIEVCPQRLSPVFLYKNTLHLKKSQLLRLDVQDCIGCGTCSYICPSKLELSVVIGQGKKMAGCQEGASSLEA